ncbi:MAG: hypothetical protein M3Z05_12070, partial [Gemmatimonadota bacterium]|nr:hypothetical protein [Gemmatimonadota bacterium]
MIERTLPLLEQRMSSERSSSQFAIACCAALAICLVVACGAGDSTNGGDSSLQVGSSASVTLGTPRSVQGGAAGGEYLFVVTDTAVNGSSDTTSFQVASTGIGVAGAVKAPSTSRSPSGVADMTRGPVLDY